MSHDLMISLPLRRWWCRCACPGALVVVAILGAGTVGADTIYLKNGRVIHTDSARVEDDRVVFIQFGHPMAMPMSEVERVEKNDSSGPARTPSTAPRSSPATKTAGPNVASSAAASPAADPEQSKEYWQTRVRAIEREAETLQLELAQAQRVERAFLFSHRSTAEARQRKDAIRERIAANERALPELRTEARRKGIPPGWLRLPPGG